MSDLKLPHIEDLVRSEYRPLCARASITALRVLGSRVLLGGCSRSFAGFARKGSRKPPRALAATARWALGRFHFAAQEQQPGMGVHPGLQHGKRPGALPLAVSEGAMVMAFCFA